MLTHPTHERLITLGLTGMAKAFEEQRRSPDLDALPFEERVGLLVDREAAERDTKRLTTRPRCARAHAWKTSICARLAVSIAPYSPDSSAATGSTATRTCSSREQPSPLHDAHLSMSLKFKSFLQGIAGRRTSQTTGCRRAFHVASVQVGGADDPGRSLTELIRRELTIFDQTAHGRRTNG